MADVLLDSLIDSLKLLAVVAVCTYIIALIVYQIGSIFTVGAFGIGTVAAVLLLVGLIYLLVRPYKESNVLKTKVVLEK